MIRKYEPGDLNELLDAWEAASAVAHTFLSPEFIAQERLNIAELYLPNTETWVWEHNGRVVGFIAMIGNEVGALFVDPPFHQQGIGRDLVDHVRESRETLEVEVFKKNTQGRAFYDRYGFKPIEEKVHQETGFALLRLKVHNNSQVD